MKLKRKNTRLIGYDYASEGLYFIKICIKKRILLFGNIKNDTMELNEIGNIANSCWRDIPNHFPNVILHEYVIMPNHIHGIIELDNSIVWAKNFSPLQ